MIAPNPNARPPDLEPTATHWHEAQRELLTTAGCWFEGYPSAWHHALVLNLLVAAMLTEAALRGPRCAPARTEPGRLDGLMLSPFVDEHGALTHVHFTVDTLPGLRLIVEAGAVTELHEALGALLGGRPR